MALCTHLIDHCSPVWRSVKIWPSSQPKYPLSYNF